MTQEQGVSLNLEMSHLICDHTEIFDVAAFKTVMKSSFDMSVSDRRNQIVAHLKEEQKRGRAAIEDAFRASPFKSRPTTSAYAFLTDQLVRSALQTSEYLLHPNPTPTKGERLSILAVGGYGRGEMAPFSDVDLLFLTPYKITVWAEKVIESTLYILWDLKLKVGHSSRTVRDCIRLGTEDFTIRTAMLEHRFLYGDLALAEMLDRELRTNLFSGTEREFIEAKLAERDARHNRQGNRYFCAHRLC